MDSNNALFIPGVVYPQPIEFHQQHILLTTARSFNLTSPALAPVDQDSINDAVFDQMLGKYTCSLETPYGNDSATTVIRECSKCVCSIIQHCYSIYHTFPMV